MAAKKRGLGRGLDSLLSSAAGSLHEDDGETLRELPLDALKPGLHQPRRHFDEDALDALADSIRAQGVVQPVVVRPLGSGYEIVAGERRWRAAQRAGLKKIPALVRSLDTRASMAVALVENIQRADLNPVEEAEALRRLIDDCELTHEQTAESVGRSRAAVTNLLRVLELPGEVQALLRSGRLSLGHAKVLLGAPVERQTQLANQVVALGLSVRQTETLVKGGPKHKPSGDQTNPFDAYETRLRNRLGVPVRIRSGSGAGGQLTIKFKDRTALDRLMQRLAEPAE